MAQKQEYLVYLSNITTTAIPVRAENPREAEIKALKEVDASLCASCTDKRSDGEWTLSAIDDAEGNQIYDWTEIIPCPVNSPQEDK